MKLNLATGFNILKTNYQVSRYTLQAITNQIANRKKDKEKRQRALEITAENATAVLKNLNVKISSSLSSDDLFHRNYFMVCNHMSYLDILVLSTIRPAVFVTSKEMEKTFFLGDMAKLGGSFFVDRVNRRKMKEEVQSLVEILESGFNLFIFPEGTSTNGLEILPFKKSLFRVPFQTQFPILPICLKYKTIDGEEFSAKNCDRVAWYGDMTFGPHLMKLMDLEELTVEVQYLEPLDPKDYPDHGSLSEAAREKITAAYFNSN